MATKTKLTMKDTHERLEMTNHLRQSVETLKKSGEMAVPYGAEYAGSFAFHFYTRTDMVLGKMEVGYATQTSDIRISPQAMNGLLPLLKDDLLRAIGAIKKVMRAETVEEKEESSETKAKLREIGLIAPGDPQ